MCKICVYIYIYIFFYIYIYIYIYTQRLMMFNSSELQSREKERNPTGTAQELPQQVPRSDRSGHALHLQPFPRPVVLWSYHISRCLGYRLRHCSLLLFYLEPIDNHSKCIGRFALGPALWKPWSSSGITGGSPKAPGESAG